MYRYTMYPPFMREPTYFLLLALGEGPAHGYGLAARAAALSGGRVKLTAGTLYGALDRLVSAGSIAVDHEDTVNGRRRRYYRIEEKGHKELADEVARLQQSVAAAKQVGITQSKWALP